MTCKNKFKLGQLKCKIATTSENIIFKKKQDWKNDFQKAIQSLSLLAWKTKFFKYNRVFLHTKLKILVRMHKLVDIFCLINFNTIQSNISH